MLALLHATIDQLQKIIEKCQIQACKGNKNLESKWFDVIKIYVENWFQWLKKYQDRKNKNKSRDGNETTDSENENENNNERESDKENKSIIN